MDVQYLDLRERYPILKSLMFPALLSALSLVAIGMASAAPATFDVWPGLAPGEHTASVGRVDDDRSNNVTRLTDITRPQIDVYMAPGKGRHPGVLVCPGGGYSILAADLEGSEVAQWLNGLGFSAFVLKYRVPNNREGAFQDAQRSLSLLRARAKDFDLDSKHLGILGFSAGGHLSARVATGYSSRSYAPVDDADKQSCRPDFAALIYPAYLVDKQTGNVAAEVQPQKGMPPVFATQTRDDPYFDLPAYSAELKSAGVDSDMAIYETGGHGYALRAAATQPCHEWPNEAAKWLTAHAGKSHRHH